MWRAPRHAQTYDRDTLEVDGKRDNYYSGSLRGADGWVTTAAKGEGAIEGTLEDYRMASDFATAFRYSRFDAVKAAARNVSALRGTVGQRHSHWRPPGSEWGRM